MKEYHRNRRIDHLKAPRKYEFHFIKRNGDIRDMINWVALIPGTKKTIVSMMDITDQKQAENKLVEQNSFLELLINHMPNQIFWKDKNLIYRGSNKIFAEVVGIKDPKMIAGKTDFDFERNADYANAYRDTDRQILESGKALFNIEEKYIDSQGNEGDIVTSKIPIKDNSGNTLGILGICVDVTRHKQAEDALRESEKRLSTLIDFSPDATLAIDADKKVIIWNRAIEEMTGISAKDMIGKGEYAYAIPFYGFARPQLIDFFWIAQDELKARYPLLEKEGDSLVIQVFCPGLYNGQGAFVWAKASPLRDSNGQLIGSIECVRDITEGKKAETALRESEEKYRRIVDTANEGIILENSIYQIDFANDRLAEMLGYETTEMIGIQIESILFPEDLADHHKKIEARIQGISEQYERRWRRKDGLAIWTIVSSKPIFDEKGHFSGSFAMITDITVRKKSEEALQESETRFRALFDDNPAMYFIVDTQGIVLAVNSFGASQLGYTIEELVGKPVLNVFYPDDKEAVKQHLIETLKHPMEVVNWEFRKVRKDGSMLWVREAVRAVYAADGQLVVFVVCEDITEQKQKDFELLKAKELAEQSNKLKDGFIANISHEIRTPLNGILGMTSLIHDSFLKYVTKENERFFTAVNKSAKRLMNTVDMIINFSRLKAGDFKIEPILISVSSVIEFLMQVYKSMAAEKSLDIILTNSAWEDMIYADEFSIETALGNIIDNAIKFTDSGAINISVYRNENEKLCVGIADTGIGISQDYLPHLFEPYTQEETGYSRSYEGIGLGLPIVKKLLELNSASITVTSKKDEGTLFTVCFNREFRRQTSTIENNQYTETQTAPSSTLQTEKKYLILIVEDDETNQLLIKSFLHKQYDTFIATNATKALAIMEKQAFDLILMDISLQHGMNGLELTKFIREEKENFNIPIIAVTGHAFPADRRRALEAGCNDYLAKPFTREELLGKVQYFLH
jgi:PAS domain S-box-containing protein